MKRLFTSLLTFAVAAVGWVSPASAQTDVTSKYITNADLSSVTGWTENNFGSTVKGSTANDGYAVEAYAGWGSLEKTDYSLTQSITLPAGNYRLVNYSFYREGEAYNTDASTSRAYLKAGDNQVLIKTLGSITAAGYANSQKEGANCFSTMMYRNTLDFTLTGETTLDIGIVGTFTQKRSWCIVGSFQLLDMDKTPNAQDVTYLITNPGFEYRDMTGWTLSENGAFGTQANSSFDNKAGGYYAEKWQAASSGALSDRSMSQTLTGLSNGNYRLSAYVYYAGTGAYIQAGDSKKEVTANSSGLYTTDIVSVTDGTLTIKAGLESGTANWVCFDRFKLEYLPDVIGDEDASTIISQAESLESQVQEVAVKTALTTAKTTFDGNRTLTNYTALQTAIANAQSSVTAYASAKTALEGRATLIATTNVYTADALNTYYTEPKAKYDAGTLTTAEANALTDPYATSAWHGDQQTSDFMGSAFGASNFAVPYGNTWSTEGNTDGSNFKTPFYEYWVADASTLGDKTLTATLTGLKANQKYKLTADVRVRVASGTATGITIDLNGGDAVTVSGTKIGSSLLYLDTYTVLGTADADGNLKINFNISGTNASWLSFQNLMVKETTAADDYADALDAAKAAFADGTYTNVTGEEKTALQNAINAAKPTTDEGYTEAASTLNSATSAFKSAAASYDAFVAATKTADPNLEYASDAKHEAFTAALAATPTSASDAVTKTAAITTALRAYYESNSLGEKYKDDAAYKVYTTSIVNAEATDGTNGWTLAQKDGNASMAIRSNESFTDAKGNSDYNYFDGGNWGGTDWTTKFEQTVKGLEPGKYILAVTSRAMTGMKWFQLYADDNKVDMPYIGSTGGVFDRGWNDNVLVFTLGADSVTIGVSACGKAIHLWHSFTRFRLVKIADLEAATLDEAETAAPATSTDYQAVTLKRTFAKGWNSIVLPFATTTDELGAAEALDYQGTKGDTIDFATATELKANTPYMVYYNDAKTDVTFAGKKIAPDEGITVTDAAGQYNFVGTYVALDATTSTIKSGDYIVNAGGIKKASGNNALKAFRAYFAAQTTTAKDLIFAVDGQVVTGIRAAELRKAVDDGARYNMAGQRVGKTYKGIVISNGKKVLVK